MRPTAFDRATAFEHRFTRAQASEVVELAFGYAVLQHEFPLSHYHNRLVVTGPIDAEQVLVAADDILGRAGRQHRFVSIDDRVAGDLVAELERAGLDHEVDATMLDTTVLDAAVLDATVLDTTVLDRAGPVAGAGGDADADVDADVAARVEAVALDVIRPTIIADWRTDLPEATDEELAQLADRTALAERGADLTRLAVRVDGVVVARAELYLDRVDRIAQFESLVTSPDHRRRGHGAALLASARARSRRAGSELLVLTADVADWPYRWYERAGFEELGRWHHLSRRLG